jgi:hypothetical protein
LTRFVASRFQIASLALVGLFFLFPAPARAEGLYADVHSGGIFLGNDSARLTDLTNGGGVRAHTNYVAGWLAVPPSVTNGRKVSPESLSSPFARIT